MNCLITVIRKVEHRDLMERYENPIEHTCDMREGQCFLSRDGKKPEGLCDSAWDSMKSFVEELAAGGGNFYDGWMKNPQSAMISCNDGFRPVSFLIETANYVCPVCGEKTLRENPDGSYEECTICHWVMDELQNFNHDFRGGFNEMSLNEARAAYKEGKEIF